MWTALPPPLLVICAAMGPGPGELYRLTLARYVLESKFIDWFIELSEEVTYFDLLLLLK